MATANKRRAREGETLKGKYRLERLLGIGGMGEVYQATNTAIGRTVAIKTLRTEHMTNEDIFTRFIREAKVANAIRHRNIVEVLDIDTDERGTPFIVQEYLAGETFSARLKKIGHQLPLSQALDILIPVIEAIGAAHRAKVVHRDIKPGNIFLSRQDDKIIPKVLDFGISKMIDTDASHTITSATMGSPAYMSPEQIEDPKSVDVRSDVWSLGVMLYEAIAGKLPFRSDSTSGLMVKICTEEPVSLQESAPGVPSAIAEVVHRCLRRRPKERYSDANELVHALRIARAHDFAPGTSQNTDNPFLRSLTADEPKYHHRTAPKMQAQPVELELVEPQLKRTNPTMSDLIQDDVPNMGPVWFSFAIVLFTLFLGVFVKPGDSNEMIRTFGAAAWIILLVSALLAAFFGFAIRKHERKVSLMGQRLAALGCFALTASLALSLLTLMSPDSGLIKVNTILMPAASGVIALGLGTAGIDAAREGVFVARSQGARAFLFLLSALALIIGIQFIARILLTLS